MRLLLSTLLCLLLCSCEHATQSAAQTWQLIAGRNPDQQPVYRTIVPEQWHRLPSEKSLKDTTKPICEYRIADEIRLVVHNFPSDSLTQRIPVQAQVARWQRQAGPGILSQECQNGFVGLRLEADNLIAWAMQLDPELYLALNEKERERRADYTIKATGPQNLLEAHRCQLEAFAKWFELIEPIPADS